jgi:hypothetical protein
MLVRLLYVSRAVGPQTTTVTGTILAAAEAHNADHGITGVLCQGQGLYLQVLEGPRSSINHLYARILGDRRHRDVELLQFEEVTGRQFGQWSMAHVQLPDAGLMDPHGDSDFDPYRASARWSMVRLEALVASGHVIKGLAAPAGPAPNLAAPSRSPRTGTPAPPRS